MTGPEHYQDAEYLLDFIENGALREGVELTPAEEQVLATRAQAHATLAHAAATARIAVDRYIGDDHDITAWARVTGALQRGGEEAPSTVLIEPVSEAEAEGQ